MSKVDAWEVRWCMTCKRAVGNIERAGGKVLRWLCSHQPRIVLSVPFDIKTCTVVWEPMK